MASITVVSGESTGDYYPLAKRTMVVGRDEALPIQVKDDRVSRKHVQIRYEEADGTDRYVLLDMNSANGTFVNDARLGSARSLGDGDVVRLGNTELMFSAVDFADGETAFQHYRQRGEHDKSTIIRKK